MEFLMGRALDNALQALGLHDPAQDALGDASLEDVGARERDAGLGNGGLGRLAACFLDAMASTDMPAFGYGIRYQNGMFAQRIVEGVQQEVPDEWLKPGNPWEVERPELHFEVGFGGHVRIEGGVRRWAAAERVRAKAFDFIVPGHRTEHVATLRLWHAENTQSLDLGRFAHGEHEDAGRAKHQADVLNWVLYPDDSTQAGRELRLKQEYLLASASVQDMLARHVRERGSVDSFAKHNALHLNDTHPAIAPIELMRLLMDEHGLDWDGAWAVVQRASSYTNHTLMPEALETWPVQMFEALLPRHLDIIYEVNRRFLEDVRVRFPADEALIRSLSLIDEEGGRRVRMAAISIVASYKVNGVSALHSNLMVQTIFSDFAKLWPTKFFNVTNGVTHRRWLERANPALSSFLDEKIGDGWRSDLTKLKGLGAHATKKTVQKEFMAIKKRNKEALAKLIAQHTGIHVDTNSLFDVQIKRIHEYKRQLLNVLGTIARYQAIVNGEDTTSPPRTVIFAGKAASAYVAAKQIIRLMHDVARVVNQDPRVAGRLKVVFLPNYGVSLAQTIIPAADLSEQISTAGTEASGTGNMKFALNGALTIGTWDGANIEMAQNMGEDNMFVFGLRADAVEQLNKIGYDPSLYYEQSMTLRRVIDAIRNGEFSQGDHGRYAALVNGLMQRDAYKLMADFDAYVAKQSEVDAIYTDSSEWAKRAILNVAGMGFFSADRAVREYWTHVWQKAPSQV
jgi:starch phosphorylase